MKTNKVLNKNAEIDLSASVSQSTSANRTYFITFIILLVYMSIIVASTTDYQLLIPNSPIRLPFVDTEVPLKMFYFIAPLIILFMHANLLQNIEVHHYKLLKWRESKSNKIIQRTLIQPFLYDFSVLDTVSNFRWIVKLFTDILFLYFSPVLLIALLWRFSSYQSIDFSIYHFIIVIFDLFFVGLFLVSVNSSLIFCCSLFLISLLPISVLGFISYYDSNILWNKLIGKDCEGESVICGYLAKDTDNDGIDEGITYPINSLFMPRISLDKFDYLAFMSLKVKNNDPAFKSINSIDLRNRNLKGALLMNIDFRDAKLTGANLQGANFDNAILSGADISSSQLEGATFNDANLVNAKFSHSTLNKTEFMRAQLDNAKLNNVNSKGSIFWSAILKSANLSDSDFTDSQFTSANLEKANLSQSVFVGSDFAHANLSLATMGSSKLSGTNFGNANLFLAIMDYAELQGSLLTSANLNGANLSFASLQGANLYDSSLNATILNNTKMLGVQFDKVKSKFGVQNNKIDIMTNTDWVKLAKLSERENYKSIIEVGENFTKKNLLDSSSQIIYNSNSLAKILPSICNHSFEALRYSIISSMTENISKDTIHIYPKETTLNTLKVFKSTEECKIHSKKLKELLSDNFYESFGLYKYLN